MALKDFGYVYSHDRKRQFTSKIKKTSRTRNKGRKGINVFDLILSSPSLSNTGVSLETFCKIIKSIITLWLWKRGVTNFFRGNATSVSLNVLIFKLLDSELTELWKFISLK